MEEVSDSKTDLAKILSYEVNLNNVYEEEDEDNFILNLRETIVNNVMEQIDKIDLTTRTIDFVVDIGCDALWRMLNIEFIGHTNHPNISSETWKGDPCPERSPKDILASKSIPIIPEQKRHVEPPEPSLKLICECQLGVHCECLLPPHRRNKAQMRHLDEALEINVETLIKTEEEYLSSSVEEELDESEYSYFQLTSTDVEETKSSHSLKNETTSSEERLPKCVLSEGFSKLQERRKQISLPLLNVTHAQRPSTLNGAIELPGIRTSIKTECYTLKEEIKTPPVKNPKLMRSFIEPPGSKQSK